LNAYPSQAFANRPKSYTSRITPCGEAFFPQYGSAALWKDLVVVLPPQVGEKYAFWCAIVRQSGPEGLRWIKGFHDEKLRGKLASLRSSRLSQQ
jgi:hypothetical protein